MRGREEEWEHPGPSGQLQLCFQRAFRGCSNGLCHLPSPAACCSSMGDVPKPMGTPRNSSQGAGPGSVTGMSGKEVAGEGLGLFWEPVMGLCFAHHLSHLIQEGCGTLGITPSFVIRERVLPLSTLCPPVRAPQGKINTWLPKKAAAFYSNLSHLHPPSAPAQGARPLAKLAANSRRKQPWKSRKGVWLCWNILPQPPHPLFLAGRGFPGRKLPDGTVPLLEHGWAVPWGGCQHCQPLFPLGLLPRGKKGCGKEENLGLPLLVQGAGRGMAGKTLGWGDAHPLPRQKSHPYSKDYRGAEAEEQSTGNI